MIRAESLRPNGQRAMVERLSLRILLLIVIQRRQVVQARRHIGMARTEGLRPDGKRTLEERLSLRMLPLGAVQYFPRLFRLWATSG